MSIIEVKKRSAYIISNCNLLKHDSKKGMKLKILNLHVNLHEQNFNNTKQIDTKTED